MVPHPSGMIYEKVGIFDSTLGVVSFPIWARFPALGVGGAGMGLGRKGR